MNYSCGNAISIDTKENKDFVINEKMENEDQDDDDDDGDDMDVQHLGVDFWALQHPMEPPDEDMPVKCPMPNSSVINNEGEIHEEEREESSRKRPELEKTMKNKNRRMFADNAEEPTISPIRQMRKRGHDTLSSSGHYTMTPLMRMPPDLSTLPADRKNITTIFRMLQQFDS